MELDNGTEVFCPECGEEEDLLILCGVFIDGYPHISYTCKECKNHWDEPMIGLLDNGIINKDGIDKWMT